ncbi:hypothetical protein [Thiofilum flexile]|uniref:hypothetical protein n=1 Tax=Thiofilum flexile TaxID=125627 RepID=UPI00035FE1DC|nr:hypothetical protein [Thiofilum flexile]
MITKITITVKIKLLTLLISGFTFIAITSYAEQGTPNAALFNKLKNTPTLDLAHPKLESADYKPLGLPIIQATPAQKAAVLAKLKHPSSLNKNYTHLEKCAWIGVNIELDNQSTTREYLFTPANSCGKPNAYQSKPFGIIQHIANQPPKVIVVDEAYQVRVWQKEAGNTQRRIETIKKGQAPSRYTQKPMEVRCHSNWSFSGGEYHYRPDYIEAYRATPSSSSKAWVIVEGQDPYVAIDQNFRCPP